MKLTDFGIAKELEYAEQLSKTFVGTFTYMSPERILGQPYDTKSDVWSFGLVMYELGKAAAYAATGRHPFENSKTYLDLAQLVEK